MRIEGMDAIVNTYVKGQDIPEVKVITKDKTVTQNINTHQENLNISQISTLEKMELPISERVVIDAIEKANRAILGANRRFEFSIHEKTKEIMVKVIDSDTNEIIRELPPEKILDMIAKMWEMAGLIVDERR